MDFQQILRQMVESTGGGRAAILMGVDGITVQDYIKEGVSCDIEALGVEYGKTMSDLARLSSSMNLGDVQEVIVTMGTNKILLRAATKQYFVAFLVSAEEVIGKARFLLRRAARDSSVELAR